MLLSSLAVLSGQHLVPGPVLAGSQHVPSGACPGPGITPCRVATVAPVLYAAQWYPHTRGPLLLVEAAVLSVNDSLQGAVWQQLCYGVAVRSTPPSH